MKNFAVVVMLVLATALCLQSCSSGGGSGTQPPSTGIKSISVTCSGSCTTQVEKELEMVATVTCVTAGDCNTAVSWSATYGSISSTGLYTAPSTVPAGGTDTVTALGADDSTKGTATITVTAAPVQTLVVWSSETEMDSIYTYAVNKGTVSDDAIAGNTQLAASTKTQLLSPAISADRDTIAYVTDGALEIDTIPFSGGTPTPIKTWTDSHFSILGLDWKPDKSEFVISYFDGTAQNCGLETVSADGSTVTPITVTTATVGCNSAAPSTPHYSSKDGSIVYNGPAADGSGHLFVVNASLATKTDLGTGGAPTFSADGTKILYLTGAGLYSMNIDGTGVVAIPNTATPGAPTWCANGDILYGDVTIGDLHLITGGTTDTDLKVSGAQPFCH